MVLDVHAVYPCSLGMCFVGKGGQTYADGDNIIGSYSGDSMEFKRYIEPAWGTRQLFTGRCTGTLVIGQFVYSAGTGSFTLFLN